jgi:Fur family peroxide stress response transcriptional regulator
VKDRFAEACKEYNLKTTPQRTAIYGELCKSKDHPSAQKIFKRVRVIFPNISFDTVVRTLSTFSEIGLADIVEGYGDVKRFDPNTDGHHHLRCIRCHKIVDFYDDSHNITISIPHSLKESFTILRKRIVIEGTCDKCKAR